MRWLTCFVDTWASAEVSLDAYMILWLTFALVFLFVMFFFINLFVWMMCYFIFIQNFNTIRSQIILHEVSVALAVELGVFTKWTIKLDKTWIKTYILYIIFKKCQSYYELLYRMVIPGSLISFYPHKWRTLWLTILTVSWQSHLSKDQSVGWKENLFISSMFPRYFYEK